MDNLIKFGFMCAKCERYFLYKKTETGFSLLQHFIMNSYFNFSEKEEIMVDEECILL